MPRFPIALLLPALLAAGGAPAAAAPETVTVTLVRWPYT